MGSVSDIKAGRATVEVRAERSQFDKQLKEIEARFKEVGESFRKIGEPMAVVGDLIGASLTEMTHHFGEMGAELNRAAKATGIGVEELSQLQYAAAQSEVPVEALDAGLKKMTKTLYDAQIGGKEGTAALAALGLTFRDLAGHSPKEQLEILATQLAKVSDYTQRAGITMQIFGKSGSDLLPLLDRSGQGINQLGQEAQSLGAVMSGEAAEAAEQLEGAQKRLKAALQGVTIQIGSALAPQLTKLAGLLTAAAKYAGDFIGKHAAGVVVLASFATGIGAIGTALSLTGFAIQGASAGVAALSALVGFFVPKAEGFTVATVAASASQRELQRQCLAATITVETLNAAIEEAAAAEVAAGAAAAGWKDALKGGWKGVAITIAGATAAVYAYHKAMQYASRSIAGEKAQTSVAPAGPAIPTQISSENAKQDKEDIADYHRQAAEEWRLAVADYRKARAEANQHDRDRIEAEKKATADRYRQSSEEWKQTLKNWQQLTGGISATFGQVGKTIWGKLGQQIKGIDAPGGVLDLASGTSLQTFGSFNLGRAGDDQKKDQVPEIHDLLRRFLPQIARAGLSTLG